MNEGAGGGEDGGAGGAGGGEDGNARKESNAGGGSIVTAKLSSSALFCCRILARLVRRASRLTGDANRFPSHTFGFFLGSESGKYRE